MIAVIVERRPVVRARYSCHRVRNNVDGHLPAETFLPIASEGKNQHALLAVNAIGSKVDSVAVGCPIARVPAVAIEGVEIVSPEKLEIGAVIALTRLVFINLDPVDELEKREQNNFSTMRLKRQATTRTTSRHRLSERIAMLASALPSMRWLD